MSILLTKVVRTYTRRVNWKNDRQADSDSVFVLVYLYLTFCNESQK